MFGFCDRHPHLGYQYFDTDMSRPLCIQDITEEEQENDLGTKNMSSRYPLINEVHEQAIRALEEEDKEITEKKRVINEQLDFIDKKMEGIRENSKSVSLEIQAMLQKALNSAQEEIYAKKNQLMSDKIEL